MSVQFQKNIFDYCLITNFRLGRFRTFPIYVGQLKGIFHPGK